MRTGKLVCLFFAVASFLPQAARAQDSSMSFYVAPWIGAGFFGGSVGIDASDPEVTIEKANINNAPAFGLFAGLRLGDRIIVEGLFSYVPSTILTPTAIADVPPLQQGYDLNIVTFGGNVGYAFSTSKTAIVPYVIAGAGGMSFSPDETAKGWPTEPDSKTEFMFNFGGGVEVPISEQARLRVDVRDYIVSTKGQYTIFPGTIGDTDSSTLNAIILSGGVSFTIG